MKILILTGILLLCACARQPGGQTSVRHDTRGNHIGISNESGGTAVYGSIGISAKGGK